MGRKCSVYNCKTGYRSQAGMQSKVSIYGFPKDREECNSWLASLPNNRLVYEKVSVHMGVCALHFPADVPKVKRGTSKYFVPAVPPSIFGNDITVGNVGHMKPSASGKSASSRIFNEIDVKPDVDSGLWQSVCSDGSWGKITSYWGSMCEDDSPSSGVEKLSVPADTLSHTVKPAISTTMVLHEDILGQGACHLEGPSVYLLATNPADSLKEHCSEDNNSASDLHDKVLEVQDSNHPERFDGVLTIITQKCAGGLIEFIGVIFGFLARKTNFYTDVDRQLVEKLVISKYEEHRNPIKNQHERERGAKKAREKRPLKEGSGKKAKSARQRRQRVVGSTGNQLSKEEVSTEQHNPVETAWDEEHVTDIEIKSNLNFGREVPNKSMIRASMEHEGNRGQENAEMPKAIKGSKKNKGWLGLYPCLFCSDVYTHPDIRESHMKTTHSEKYSKFAPEINGLTLAQKTRESVEHDKNNETFKEKAFLKGNENYHPKIFKCSQCERAFHREDHLQKHIITHLEDRSVVCDVCGKRLKNKKYLKMHARAHSNERPYKCQVCLKSFFRSTYLKIHLRTHTGEKPYQCNDCPKAFKDRTDLTRHQRIHTGERPYTCDICKLSFKKMWTMKSHRKIHFREEQVKTFAGLRNPTIRRITLDSEKRFMCDVCGVKFKTNGGLKFHQMKHTGEKSFQCDICQKAFYLNQYLKLHRAQHFGECPYKCSTCNKVFNSKGELEIHKRRHAGVKPYKCSECSSAFVCANDLKRHRIHKHIEVKLYNCDLCDKPFKRKQCILQHKRLVHSNERPYKCDKCEKTFKENSSLNKHRRIHSPVDGRVKLKGQLSTVLGNVGQLPLPWPGRSISGREDHATASSEYC